MLEANRSVDDLDGAAKAYEELFKIDPRDIKTAINISDIYLENDDYRQALKWADKASTLGSKNGEGEGQKGKVYYQGWDNFRQNPFTNDDRIVAKLAYDYFVKAEKKDTMGLINLLGLGKTKKMFCMERHNGLWLRIKSREAVVYLLDQKFITG